MTHRVHPDAVEMLLTVCDIALVNADSASALQELKYLARDAHALLTASPARIDDSLLAGCRELRIVACTFRFPEHIDIEACTRRGIWVTNVMTHQLGVAAEIEAARNILDILSGDTPRSALNQVLQTAA
jgi:phosphonate dehydrogenase